ncbi:MAG: hypothetical protein CBCREVIR_0416 [Candidatus Burkholderia crenata]|nr:MAG: hypothetical protein CBCREVIR_0416 [Candidatus Burkholderia crenata]
MPQILSARNVSPDVTGMWRTFNGLLRDGYRLVFDTSSHKKPAPQRRFPSAGIND